MEMNWNWKCPKCGFANKRDAINCIKCGEKITYDDSVRIFLEDTQRSVEFNKKFFKKKDEQTL